MSSNDSGYSGTTEDAVDGIGFPGEAPIGARGTVQGFPWALMLTVFLRVLATIWMLKGLMAWSAILGLGPTPFLDLAFARQVSVIVFALVQISVAVGLWLLTTWGRVLWLVVAAAEAFLPLAMSGLPFSVWNLGLFGVFSGLFLLLAWKDR